MDVKTLRRDAQAVLLTADVMALSWAMQEARRLEEAVGVLEGELSDYSGLVRSYPLYEAVERDCHSARTTLADLQESLGNLAQALQNGRAWPCQVCGRLTWEAPHRIRLGGYDEDYCECSACAGEVEAALRETGMEG